LKHRSYHIGIGEVVDFRDRMIAAPLKRGKVIKSFFEGRKISAIE